MLFGRINLKTGIYSKGVMALNNLHEGHRERMINRLKQNGSEVFESHELLEMMLYSSNKRANTNPIAHLLLKEFGSLAGVFTADESELLKIKGVGNATVQMITTVRAVCQRLFEESVVPGEPMNSSARIKEYCEKLLKLAQQERMYLIFIDGNYNFVAQELICEGSFEAVKPDIISLIQTIAKRRCPVVVIAHNHPKGSEIPSAEDKVFTRNLFNLLDKTNVYLADHVVVGMYGSYSMRENKLLPDLWD